MAPNPRTWSIESIAAFHRARDDRRRRHALPAWDTLTDAQKVEANTTGKERADVLEGEIARLKTQAWSVSRYPILGAFPAPRDGWLVLPKAFNQRIEGSTKAKVSKGADLGLLVHAYCTERVDAAAQTTPNYVSSDSVHAVRGEYLGPDPRVASYRYVDSCYHVKWFDSFLDVLWIGNKRWVVEVEYNEVMQGWMVVDDSEY